VAVTVLVATAANLAAVVVAAQLSTRLTTWYLPLAWSMVAAWLIALVIWINDLWEDRQPSETRKALEIGIGTLLVMPVVGHAWGFHVIFRSSMMITWLFLLGFVSGVTVSAIWCVVARQSR
jgi:hypothetical protein